MRRSILALSLLTFALAPTRSRAQLTPDEEAEVELDPAATSDDAAPEADPYAEEEDPSLREAEEEVPVEEEAPAEEAATVSEQEESETPEPAGDPSRLSWSTPASAVTLHGYMRTRAEIWRNFHIGRDTDIGSEDDEYPFQYFYPLERGAPVVGGCSSGSGGGTETCYNRASRFRSANMRLRLQPTIAVSDDVMVHMLIDALDNVVLGSTPSNVSAGSYRLESGVVSGLTIDSFAATMNPAIAGRNSLQDSIYVRRAWAEVHARDLGQIWFGRMPNHWGLGMLFNDGAGIDGDFSSDVDRIMGIVQIQGFQLAAAWDFANQGAITYPGALNGVPFDASQRDDVRQFSFIGAHRLDPEEQRRRLARGDAVFNGGVYFQYRTQELSTEAYVDPVSGVPSRIWRPNDPVQFVRRDARSFTLDGWAQFLWKDLRVELETAMVIGRIRNTGFETFDQPGRTRITQGGYTLQVEYRALDQRLGVYFDNGLASGDASAVGLSIREDLVNPRNRGSGDRITTFSFHPNYRIDLILFRNILGSVSGAYYFRPGISYDIRRTDHGQIVGVRADAVYSRAVVAEQTYGQDPNLGLELDASIYYRSELGPDLLDGFYVIANYGLLFPLAGLGYGDSLTGETRDGLAKAQTFRLILGVRF